MKLGNASKSPASPPILQQPGFGKGPAQALGGGEMVGPQQHDAGDDSDGG